MISMAMRYSRSSSVEPRGMQPPSAVASLLRRPVIRYSGGEGSIDVTFVMKDARHRLIM